MRKHISRRRFLGEGPTTALGVALGTAALARADSSTTSAAFARMSASGTS